MSWDWHLATSSMESPTREGDVESGGNTSSDVLTGVLSDELKGLNTQGPGYSVQVITNGFQIVTLADSLLQECLT